MNNVQFEVLPVAQTELWAVSLLSFIHPWLHKLAQVSLCLHKKFGANDPTESARLHVWLRLARTIS